MKKIKGPIPPPPPPVVPPVIPPEEPKKHEYLLAGVTPKNYTRVLELLLAHLGLCVVKPDAGPLNRNLALARIKEVIPK